MAFRGAKKCCVCKAFCSKNTTVCGGCGLPCHDKCRTSNCCRPCNNCWGKKTRSCVCGKSFRSMGIFVEREILHTPPVATTSKKRKRIPTTINTTPRPPVVHEKENVGTWLFIVYFIIDTYASVISILVPCFSGGQHLADGSSSTRVFEGIFIASTNSTRRTQR